MTEQAVPHASFVDWLENAAGAAQAVTEGLSGWEVGGILGAVAAVGLTALGVIRATGLGGPLVSMAAGLLENAATKKQKQHASDLAGFGVKAIEIIEKLPEEAASPIKKAISKSVDPEQEAAIRKELERMAKS